LNHNSKEAMQMNASSSQDSQNGGAIRPTTAFIVGAGAVEGAWKPVLSALQAYHDFDLTTDGANSFLARLVYLVRWWAGSDAPNAAEELKRYKKLLIEVRSSICRALNKAESKGQIRVREEFEEIVRDRVLHESEGMMLVTTNWDNVVGTALRKLLSNKFWKFEPRPLHVHGTSRAPNVMYLPTEMTREPYRLAEEEQQIGRMHGAIWRGMENCHRSVVYGLSISPLDAELGQILACGWSSKVLKEIDVISPDNEAVAHRVNLLLDRQREISVKGYRPSGLKMTVDYSIIRKQVSS
jgi:hypothetical protein